MPSRRAASPPQTLEERARALFKDLPPARRRDAKTSSSRADPPTEPAARAAHRRSRPAAPRRPARPFIPPRVQRPAPAPAARRPSRVFSSSAPATGRAPAAARPGGSSAPGGGAAGASGQRPHAPPVRTFGPMPRRAAAARRARRASARRWTRKRCRPTSCETLPGMKGPGGRKGAAYRRAVVRRRSRRPRWPRSRAREDDRPRQRVHHGHRARRSHEGSGHPDRRVRVQEAGPDGHHQPAARLRPDRAHRVGVRLPGGAGGRVRRRGREPDQAEENPEELVAAAAGRHHHGSRRPRQDVAARLHPQGQRRRRRGRRHHPAHRRLPRRAARRQADHLPRHAGPRGLHRHACPRRPGHRHRRARRGRRRPGHAADDRGDHPRPQRRRADDRRDQQDRPAHRQRAEGEAGPAAARRRARGVRRHGALSRDLGQEGHRRRSPARADSAAGGDPRSQGQSDREGTRHRPRSTRSIRARVRWPRSWCNGAR